MQGTCHGGKGVMWTSLLCPTSAAAGRWVLPMKLGAALVLLQRSQGFKPQGQGEVAQGHLSPLPGLMLPAANHYPLARMCFQNICSRGCLARSDLETDRQYWLGEWRNNEKLPLLCFMLFNEHKIEYLLIQPSTEWAGTLKAAVVASKSLYKHGT